MDESRADKRERIALQMWVAYVVTYGQSYGKVPPSWGFDAADEFLGEADRRREQEGKTDG